MSKKRLLTGIAVVLALGIYVWWSLRQTYEKQAEVIKECIQFQYRDVCDPALLYAKQGDVAGSRYGAELLQFAVESHALDFASLLAMKNAEVSDAALAAAWDWPQPLNAPSVVAYSGETTPTELVKSLLIHKYGRGAPAAAASATSGREGQRKMAHEVLKLLLDGGADPNAPGPDGKTPLAHARETGDEYAAMILRTKGAK